MTTFDEREQAFERRFVHEEDRRFQERARRNRLLARWACARMALGPDDTARFTDTFVGETVPLDDEALLARLALELAAAGRDAPASVLRREMQRCAGLARAESRVGLALDQGPAPQPTQDLDDIATSTAASPDAMPEGARHDRQGSAPRRPR
ncbi:MULTISPECIES: ATPase inhibitor subunit zeta [Methylobacterium]|uniref:ATPase inhibitor subunit zeta n=1 Tax=Methylobacterium TaxID=407 RepID=UPI0013ED1518|nr:ATPase inhibitor subunit zeta [Methylobacterium sp. DB0501]NGM34994.1 DUF1476 family protein [Methylobacterium sp. DB0501]